MPAMTRSPNCDSAAITSSRRIDRMRGSVIERVANAHFFCANSHGYFAARIYVEARSDDHINIGRTGRKEGIMRASPVRLPFVVILCIVCSATLARAATHTCNTIQEFHNVLAGTTTPALQLGDTIILNAANTFIPINNNFVLRNLTTGTG